MSGGAGGTKNVQMRPNKEDIHHTKVTALPALILSLNAKRFSASTISSIMSAMGSSFSDCHAVMLPDI